MEWIKIFSSAAEAQKRILPDHPQRVIIGSKRISLVLHKDIFYAIQDACTHNGESLSKGQVNYLGEIVCPWHGYRFNLKSGKACDSSCADLETFPIQINESGFFIGI